MIGEPRLDRAIVLAEAQHHAALIGRDLEEAGEQPDQDHRERRHRDAPAAEIAARQHRAELVLAAAQQFLKIGRT